MKIESQTIKFKSYNFDKVSGLRISFFWASKQNSSSSLIYHFENYLFHQSIKTMSGNSYEAWSKIQAQQSFYLAGTRLLQSFQDLKSLS